MLFTVFVLSPFGIAVFLALFYPIAWLALMALLAALPAILIVWTYRLPKELVVALALTSLTSLAYGAALLLGVHRLSRSLSRVQRLCRRRRPRHPPTSSSVSRCDECARGAAASPAETSFERAAQEQERQAQPDECREEGGEPVELLEDGEQHEDPEGDEEREQPHHGVEEGGAGFHPLILIWPLARSRFGHRQATPSPRA